MLRLRSHARRRTAFTLLELMVSVTIIAVAAAAVIPSYSDSGRARVIAATSIITSDIELAQVMTISYPSEPVVVRFDPAQNRYWLAYADSPETPIARPRTKRELGDLPTSIRICVISVSKPELSTRPPSARNRRFP